MVKQKTPDRFTPLATLSMCLFTLCNSGGFHNVFHAFIHHCKKHWLGYKDMGAVLCTEQRQDSEPRAEANGWNYNLKHSSPIWTQTICGLYRCTASMQVMFLHTPSGYISNLKSETVPKVQRTYKAAATLTCTDVMWKSYECKIQALLTLLTFIQHPLELTVYVYGICTVCMAIKKDV